MWPAGAHILLFISMRHTNIRAEGQIFISKIGHLFLVAKWQELAEHGSTAHNHKSNNRHLLNVSFSRKRTFVGLIFVPLREIGFPL
jgi:hypothetical protein